MDKLRNRILYIVDSFSACAWYRCSVPGSELQKLGMKVEVIDHADYQTLRGFDVIVFLRHHSKPAFELMRDAKAWGKFVVYDIDDALWQLEPSNPAHSFYSRPEVVKGLERCIRAANLVTTTTETLAAELRTRNPNVKVLPNMLLADCWPYPQAKQQNEDRVVLGWAGSETHWDDLAEIRDVVPRLLDEHQTASLVCMGMSSLPFPAHERVSVASPVALDEYPKVLGGFDIGLAPLADTPFNHCKSELKALEYSMVGIPVVASDVSAYNGFIRDGETGFVVSDADDWSRVLSRLIEDRDLREKIGTKAQEAARGRLIEGNVDKWVEAYSLSQAPC